MRTAAAALALTLAACGAPAPVERIVLVTLDTTRADRLGCYGYPGAETPVLDALAGEGVVFEQAVAPVPTTLPSHCSILTGLYPQDHGVRYNTVHRLDESALTLAEALREAGWATAGFPASFIVGRRTGLGQGFDHWEEPPQPPRGQVFRTGALLRPVERTVEGALAWLASHDDGQRAFVWLHVYEPHWPYTPPFPFDSRFADRPYDGELARVDRALGELFDALRADPAWPRTAVVVTADHGEGLYDHGEQFHGYLVYESTQRVPLIVRTPQTAPARVAAPASLVDVMPTLLELAGAPVPEGLRGRSLVPALRGESLPARELYFETLTGTLNYGWAEVRGLRRGRYKLIDAAGAGAELYDLEVDPGETADVSSLEAGRAGDLRQALAELGRPAGGLPPESTDPEAATMDPATTALLASLGYVGGPTEGGSAARPAHPRTLIDLHPELLEAQQALAMQRWPRLLELCRYFLERDPKNKWAWHAVAVAGLATGDTGEARAAAAELVRLYPDLDSGYLMLGRAEAATGRDDAARRILRRGRERLPESAGLEAASLTAELDAGAWEACEEVDAALADHPGDEGLEALRRRCRSREAPP